MLTFFEQAKIDNNDLVVGVIKSVMAQNQMSTKLPSKSISHAVHTYTRQKLGFNQRTLVDTYDTSGGLITNASQPFEEHSTQLTSIIGQIEISKRTLEQNSTYNDALGEQMMGTTSGMGKTYDAYFLYGNASNGFTVATKWTTELDSVMEQVLNPADYLKLSTEAKRHASVSIVIGNNITQNAMFEGTITSGTGTAEVLTANGVLVMEAAYKALYGSKGFDGLNSFLRPQASGGNDLTATAGVNTRTDDNEIFNRLDVLRNRISSRGPGAPDWIMMSSRGLTRYTSAIRKTGALATTQEVIMSTGNAAKLYDFGGTPIFVNNYIGHSISSNLDADLSAGNLLTNAGTDDVYMGTFDSGALDGICGLHGKNSMGIELEDLGSDQKRALKLHRLTMETGLVNYTELGLVKGKF